VLRQLIALTLQLGPQLGFGREDQLVPAREHLLILVQYGVAHDRGVLMRDSEPETRNLLESGGTDGHPKHPEEPLETLIAPVIHPGPLP
jgi:hypothetical protein